jgi:TonB-dependent starch-binding outer membrane protein SusC
MTSSDFIEAETFFYNNGLYNSTLSNNSTYPIVSPVVELLSRRRIGQISALDSAAQINSYKELDLRTDLKKYVYKKSLNQQHYLFLSGGSPTMNYSFSAGYNCSSPNIQKSKSDEQFSITSVAEFRVIKNMEVRTSINLNQIKIQSVDFSLPNLYPYAKLIDSFGNYLTIPFERRLGYLDTAGGGKLLDWKYRPLEEIGLNNRSNVLRSGILNLNISYKLGKWFTAQIISQYGIQITNGRQLYDFQTYFTRNLINQYTNFQNSTQANPIPKGAILDLNTNQSNSYNIRTQFNFNKSFKQKHLITALISGELSQQKSVADANRFYGYNSLTGSYASNIDYYNFYRLYGRLNNTAIIPSVNKVIEGAYNRFASVLSNVSYTYNDKYTLYASARKDGSNVFGVNTNNKWKPLWSIAGSWDISKEGFYAINWMPTFKIRASYGYSGNVNNLLSGLLTINYQLTPANYTNLQYSQINDVPNPDLRWEQIRIMNLGVDFSLFKNRIESRFEIFSKRSTDLISSLPFAPSSGVPSFPVNSASLKGTGFELNITSKNINKGLKWITSFGLSHAKTTIINVYSAVGTFRAKDFVSYGINQSPGRLAYGISSYKWAGLDPLSGDPQGYLNGQVSKNYNAIFNDSVDNQVFHGSAIPLFSGFILNSFTWKSLSISVNITYFLDYYFRKPSLNYDALGRNWIGHAEYANRWKKAGDENFTNVPSMIYPVPAALIGRDAFYQGSEINVLRGDHVRFQDLCLQYTMGRYLTEKLPFKSLQFFLYVNNLNLIIWRRNNSNLDPQYIGSANFTVPSPRSYTTGLKVNL